MVLSGERRSGPDANGLPTSYGPLSVGASSGDSDVPARTGEARLAPGVWVHRVAVVETGQSQARRTLVVADPAASSRIDWKLFASVLVVNRGDDSGNGTCDSQCTLRDAIATASKRVGPVLIRFDHSAFFAGRASIEVTGGGSLALRAAGMAIDGTDAEGNPSPLDAFAARLYPTTVTLHAPNAGAKPGLTCPCNEGGGGVLRVGAEDVSLVGLALERVLAPEGSLCCGDQDLVAFDPGSRGSGIETSLLDGGAQAMTSAEVPSGVTEPATGKDCIDASSTGATADRPIVIAGSEVRFCHDRGAKSQNGWLRLERNWVHHNLRGGLFAQSPTSSAGVGVIDARDNLIEQNGLNCPTGNAASCGAQQVVTRGGASELSAQGPLTQLLSTGNVVREGTSQGLFFEDGSAGGVFDTYVCGINRNAGGKGLLSQRSSGSAADLVVRGSTVVYNDDAGIKLRGRIGADLGTSAEPGANAFCQNGSGTRRNLINVLDAPVPVVSARGNEWEHCCVLRDIGDNDTNNTIGKMDRVDVSSPLAPDAPSTLRLDGASPRIASKGEIVRLTGVGFDAISGHYGGVAGDCRALAEGNRCAPLNGTCVEFLVGGEWQPALDVLGVTPTTVIVRSPVTCTESTQVRVRRAGAVSEAVELCRN